MASNKYPFFNRAKNPFKKNERTVLSPTKNYQSTPPGWIIFEENGETPFTPPPSPITYLLLAENGFSLMAESGNNLEIQY